MIISKKIYLHYYSQVHVSAASFGAIFRLDYFLKKAMCTIDSTVIDCEISHCIFKIL